MPAYSEIYGQHPRTFVFAHDGSKLPVDSPPAPDRRTKFPVVHPLSLCECEPPLDASTHRRSVNVSRIYQHRYELTGSLTGTRRSRSGRCGRPCRSPAELTGWTEARPMCVRADMCFPPLFGSSLSRRRFCSRVPFDLRCIASRIDEIKVTHTYRRPAADRRPPGAV